MKNSNDLRKEMQEIIMLSISNCECKFHILPFIVTYLYANERIRFIKTDNIDNIRDTIVVYKDLGEAFCKDNIRQEELKDYNEGIEIYVLTCKLKQDSKTDSYIKSALELTLAEMLETELLFNISDTIFNLYNLLSTYRTGLIKEYLDIIFLKTMDYFIFVTTPIQDYYKVRNQKSCNELCRLIIKLLTKDNIAGSNIAHPMAGPANFIEHIAKNDTYQATISNWRFLCLYQLFSDITNKETFLTPHNAEKVIDIAEHKEECIIIDNISIGHKVWNLIAETALSKKNGIFLVENDVLYEFNNKKLHNNNGLDIFERNISHVIFLPHDLVLIKVSNTKKRKDFLLFDETQNTNINSDAIINDISKQENSYLITEEEYRRPDFVFGLNQILSKRECIKIKNKKNAGILLSEIITSSTSIGHKINAWCLDSHDVNYSKFLPFYKIMDGRIVNISRQEAYETNAKRCLLVNVCEKTKFQPKIVLYTNLEQSLSYDDYAFEIKEGVLDYNCLIYEMNQDYFIKQLFPTNKKRNDTTDENILRCYIKIPETHDSTTPLKRQRLYYNEEKLKYLRTLLDSFDYNIDNFTSKSDNPLIQDSLIKDGRYRIIENLGAGGYGIVYKAFDLQVGKNVAIKEFFNNEKQLRAKNGNDVFTPMHNMQETIDARKMFMYEAIKIKEFSSENIIKIFDVFDDNDTCYYSMEFIEGCNLKEYIASNGALKESEAIKIIKNVAMALKEMHNHKMCHYDVNPENIMLDRKNKRIVLVDFGSAKTSAEKSDIIYTKRLFSPPGEDEKYLATCGFYPKWDIYSLGATLYYMIKGYIATKTGHQTENEGSIITKSIDKINTIQKDVAIFEKSAEISDATWICIDRAVGFYLNRQKNIDEFLAMLPCE